MSYARTVRSFPKVALMRRPVFSVLVVVLPILAGGSLWMRSLAGSPSPKPEKPHLVSIRVRDANVQDVLTSFADQVEAKLVVDPGIQGKLSIQAEKSDLGEVMNDLCTVYECDWKLSPSPHVLTVTRRSSG